jgi:hypothetical protein
MAVYHKVGHGGEPEWNGNLAQIDTVIYQPGEGGIHIWDISAPQTPIHFSFFALDGTFRDIQIIGHIAYVSSLEHGLIILNVENPYLPQVISSCPTPGSARNLEVVGDTVYMGADTGGLQIIDISDLQNPLIIGNYPTAAAGCLSVSGNLVFLVNYMKFILTIDVSDPTSPFLINSYNFVTDSISDIYVEDSIAYMTIGSEGLRIYHVSSSGAFQQISAYPTNYGGGNILKIGERIYLSSGSGGVRVIDVSDVENPTLITEFNTPTMPSNLIVYENYAYVNDYYTGLEVYDISETHNPNLIGSYLSPDLNNCQTVSVLGNYAIVTDADSNFGIFDISNPKNPQLANTYGVSHYLKDFIIVGNKGYAISGSRFFVFNMINPVYPEIVSYLDIGGDNKSLAYRNNHVYVAASYEGVKIINVGSSENPFLVSVCPTPGSAYDLEVVSDFIYVADYDAGLQIIDKSDIENPVLLPAFNIPYAAYSLTLKNYVLYVAGSYDGLILMNVLSPENPFVIDTITPHPDSRFITKPLIVDNYLYVEDRNWNEISIFDISTLTAPQLINRYRWNLTTRGWAAFDNYLFTANNLNGISILDLSNYTSTEETISSPAAFSLSNFPNPFNPSTTIEFNIEPNQQNEQITLEIYNIKGQKIRQFKMKNPKSKINEIVWDGRNDQNQPVSSGIYLYQLNVDGKTEATRKCLLLK